MSDRRYPRPRSPIHHPGRSSLPSVNYGGYGDLHAVPTSRREVLSTPRSSADRVGMTPAPVVTTYKITPDVAPVRSSSIRAGSRHRRSTLDNASRPQIITTQAPSRRPAVHMSGRPASPVQDPYRSSDETGEYYTIPASSSSHRSSRHRPSYSATIDNSDMNIMARETGKDRLLRVGSGRDGVMYPHTRPRPIHSGSLVRHPDTVADDYGDDGYGYTNPRDLVQYDLNRTARYSGQRHDSLDSPRSARPTSVGGYGDFMPRSFDARGGPPPTTRGLDKVNGRASVYDAPPSVRMPMPGVDPVPRAARVDSVYDSDSGRKSRQRPVSLYHEPERQRRSRDDYYEREESRDRREKPYRAERYDDSVEQRGFGIRTDRADKNDYDSKNDYEKRGDYDKKNNYDKKNDYDRRDHDRKDDNDDKHDRKRDSLAAAGLGLAGTALGLNALNKSSKDDDRDDRDDRRRRDDDRDTRRKRESRDDRESIDLSGRDPKERYAPKEERNSPDSAVPNDRVSSKELKPEMVDINGRNPQEKRPSRDDRDLGYDASEPRRRHRTDAGSRSDSPQSDDVGVPRSRREHRSGAPAFNPHDTLDLRAVKDALNKQDVPVAATVAPPAIPPKEPIREQAAFDPKNPREISNIQAELAARDRERDDRGRRDLVRTNSDEERRPQPRLVSPPREDGKKVDDKPVKSILRQPREKFPEDPSPIREGVAPLKDAKKDGVPPEARWTKISRKLVNPEALEAGKERYEPREEFVIVLRVLSREEIQGYAEVTQRIRANREEEIERERHIRRRDRHQRHKRERRDRRSRHDDEDNDYEYRRHHGDRDGAKGKESDSESDTTEDEAPPMKQIDAGPSNAGAAAPGPRPRRITFDEGPGSNLGALSLEAGPSVSSAGSNLREDPNRPGTYLGYTRAPPRNYGV